MSEIGLGLGQNERKSQRFKFEMILELGAMGFRLHHFEFFSVSKIVHRSADMQTGSQLILY